ncbi:MAG: TRAP transporter small permease [Gammaproteobacteria bacterium]
MLHACRRLERLLCHVELGTALFAYAAILLLAIVDIVGRNLMGATLAGSDLAVRQLVLWVALPGAALAVAAQRHLHLDPAGLAARPRWTRLTALPFNLAAAGVCALLARAAWAYWRDEMQYQSPDMLWLAWLGVILPITMGLLVLHFVLRAVLALQEARA